MGIYLYVISYYSLSWLKKKFKCLGLSRKPATAGDVRGNLRTARALIKVSEVQVSNHDVNDSKYI